MSIKSSIVGLIQSTSGITKTITVIIIGFIMQKIWTGQTTSNSGPVSEKSKIKKIVGKKAKLSADGTTTGKPKLAMTSLAEAEVLTVSSNNTNPLLKGDQNEKSLRLVPKVTENKDSSTIEPSKEVKGKQSSRTGVSVKIFDALPVVSEVKAWEMLFKSTGELIDELESSIQNYKQKVVKILEAGNCDSEDLSKDENSAIDAQSRNTNDEHFEDLGCRNENLNEKPEQLAIERKESEDSSKKVVPEEGGSKDLEADVSNRALLPAYDLMFVKSDGKIQRTGPGMDGKNSELGKSSCAETTDNKDDCEEHSRIYSNFPMPDGSVTNINEDSIKNRNKVILVNFSDLALKSDLIIGTVLEIDDVNCLQGELDGPQAESIDFELSESQNLESDKNYEQNGCPTKLLVPSSEDKFDNPEKVSCSETSKDLQNTNTDFSREGLIVNYHIPVSDARQGTSTEEYREPEFQYLLDGTGDSVEKLCLLESSFEEPNETEEGGSTTCTVSSYTLPEEVDANTSISSLDNELEESKDFEVKTFRVMSNDLPSLDAKSPLSFKKPDDPFRPLSTSPSVDRDSRVSLEFEDSFIGNNQSSDGNKVGKCIQLEAVVGELNNAEVPSEHKDCLTIDSEKLLENGSSERNEREEKVEESVESLQVDAVTRTETAKEPNVKGDRFDTVEDKDGDGDDDDDKKKGNVDEDNSSGGKEGKEGGEGGSDKDGKSPEKPGGGDGSGQSSGGSGSSGGGEDEKKGGNSKGKKDESSEDEESDDDDEKVSDEDAIKRMREKLKDILKDKSHAMMRKKNPEGGDSRDDSVKRMKEKLKDLMKEESHATIHKKNEGETEGSPEVQESGDKDLEKVEDPGQEEIEDVHEISATELEEQKLLECRKTYKVPRKLKRNTPAESEPPEEKKVKGENREDDQNVDDDPSGKKGDGKKDPEKKDESSGGIESWVRSRPSGEGIKKIRDFFGAKNKKEGKSQEKPEVSQEKPKVSEEKPEVSREKPKVSEEKPEVSREKPKVSEEKPVVPEEKPQSSFVEESVPHFPEILEDIFEEAIPLVEGARWEVNRDDIMREIVNQRFDISARQAIWEVLSACLRIIDEDPYYYMNERVARMSRMVLFRHSPRKPERAATGRSKPGTRLDIFKDLTLGAQLETSIPESERQEMDEFSKLILGFIEKSPEKSDQKEEGQQFQFRVPRTPEKRKAPTKGSTKGKGPTESKKPKVRKPEKEETEKSECVEEDPEQPEKPPKTVGDLLGSVVTEICKKINVKSFFDEDEKFIRFGQEYVPMSEINVGASCSSGASGGPPPPTYDSSDYSDDDEALNIREPGRYYRRDREESPEKYEFDEIGACNLSLRPEPVHTGPWTLLDGFASPSRPSPSRPLVPLQSPPRRMEVPRDPLPEVEEEKEEETPEPKAETKD